MPKIRALKPDFWTDDAIVELTPFARLLFMGLWTHSCDNGHVEDKPRQIKMRILPGDEVRVADLLAELEESGRIERRNGWVVILNFKKHQKVDKRFFVACQRPGCVKPDQRATTTSQREPRGGHDEPPPPEDPYDTWPHDEPTSSPRRGHHEGVRDGGDGELDGDGDGDGDGEQLGALTLAEAPRPDVDRICDHLAARIADNGSKRPTVTAKWRDSARLMLDRDGRSEDDVHAAIEWSQADEFWRGNVLSLPKLREKYDQLRLQASRSPRSASGDRNQQQRDLLARALERAEAKERNGA